MIGITGDNHDEPRPGPLSRFLSRRRANRSPAEEFEVQFRVRHLRRIANTFQQFADQAHDRDTREQCAAEAETIRWAADHIERHR